MSVTDLTNTKWGIPYFNSSNINQIFEINGVLTFGGVDYNFTRMGVAIVVALEGSSDITYLHDSQNSVAFLNQQNTFGSFGTYITRNRGYGYVGWYAMAVSASSFSEDIIVNITSGNDVTNTTLITWLETYGRQIIEGKYTVTTKVYPTGGGTTSGDGQYTDGTNFTVTATPTSGSKYKFVNWTDSRSGEIKSTSASYTSTNYGEQNVNLTANFEYEGYKPSTDPEDLPSSTIIDTKATDWMKHGDTKMYQIYVPQENSTTHELQALAAWLYSQDFLSVLGQAIAGLGDAPKVTDYVISFMVIPVTVPTEATAKAVKCGWFQPTTSYGTLTCHYTNSNYVQVDCGTVSVAGIYGGALDYQTNCDIYLPFIGYQSLETYDVIGHSINPIYQIDVLTGDCICKIKIDNSVKYQFTGSCGYSIPLSEINNNGIINKGLKGAISLATAMAAPPSIGSTEVTTQKIRHNKAGQITSRTTTTQSETSRSKPSLGQTMLETIGSFANMGNGASRGGSLQGNTGYMGVGKPYLNITRPKVNIPTNFGKYNGFPCNKYLSLSSLQGFTMIQEIHLTGFTCTDDELEEIEDLMAGGIVL